MDYQSFLRGKRSKCADSERSPDEPTGRADARPRDERNCARTVMTGSAIPGRYQNIPGCSSAHLRDGDTADCDIVAGLLVAASGLFSFACSP
jgi:hypothetical protein